jgi:uncharacterized repeat protein (TIGR01451 family)
MYRFGALLGAAWLLAAASGQATLPAIEIRTIAEVETKSVDAGREIVHLSAADRVVPGDRLVYTVEIRNTGTTDVLAPTVTRPVPAHVAYVADSATGPGAEVTYSADGGITFARPEALSARGADGTMRLVKASDYTHIRWQFKNTLKSKSVAFARFRAVVK